MIMRVIDTETTGTDKLKDKVIEIASIDLTHDGGYKNPLEHFIKHDEIEIPSTASAIHHIIAEDLEGGISQEQAYQIFDGADIYIAHNNRFDMQFLPSNYGPWIDTMRCAAHVWPEMPSYSNQAIRYELGLINPLGVNRKQIDPHRALSDVLVTGAIAHELLKVASLDDLKKWSQEPMPMREFKFGKHKGEKLSEVPFDYLSWIYEKSDLDQDVKWNAKQEMNKRQSR